MIDVTPEVAEELAGAVRRNEGLRQAIAARGMSVKDTLEVLARDYRELFKDAHAVKAEALNG